MDEAEWEVLDHLVRAWNAFLKLPNEHPDQVDEFRHTFHDLQRQIMVRPVRRAMAEAKSPE